MTTARPGTPIEAERGLDGQLRRFTRLEYHGMAESGILRPDDRVELVGGMVMMMSPVGPRHAGVVVFLDRHFSTRLSGRALCSVQNPLGIGEHSEPQPDIMLLEPRDDCYRSGHPLPEDVLLLVMVAESSLELDRTAKLRLYARAGVREYWIVDLARGVLIVHRRPGGDAYAGVTEHARGATVAPLAFPDCEVRVADVLG